MNANVRIWEIRFGKCTLIFYTHYHAEQMARALRLNRTPFTMKGK